MNPTPEDNADKIGEIIRTMLEKAGMSDHPAPVIFNFRIFVNMPDRPGELPGRVLPGHSATIEPAVEVQRVDDEIKLLTELPGLSPEQVQVMFSGSTVHIRAGDGVRNYEATADVPPAEKDSVSVSFRHGVLEITYRERTGVQESPVSES